MYWYMQPSTCTKCGHRQLANGTDDSHVVKLNNHSICPTCYDKMLEQFCGYMKRDAEPLSLRDAEPQQEMVYQRNADDMGMPPSNYGKNN